MKDVLNCPNCGAPIQTDVCPYCGSVFLDWACFDVKTPTFVKIKNQYGHIVLMKVKPISVDYRLTMDSTYFYSDNRRVHSALTQSEVTIDAEFIAVPFLHALTDKTVLSIDIDPEKTDEDTKRAILTGFKGE